MTTTTFNFSIDKNLLDKLIEQEIEKLANQGWETDDSECREELRQEIVKQLKEQINELQKMQ